MEEFIKEIVSATRAIDFRPNDDDHVEISFTDVLLDIRDELRILNKNLSIIEFDITEKEINVGIACILNDIAKNFNKNKKDE